MLESKVCIVNGLQCNVKSWDKCFFFHLSVVAHEKLVKMFKMLYSSVNGSRSAQIRHSFCLVFILISVFILFFFFFFAGEQRRSSSEVCFPQH